MKFKSVNAYDTFDFNDSELKSIKFNESQMTITAAGVIVKATNDQNKRFEDMFTVLLEMTFDQFQMTAFDEQGYRYFDVNGNLLNKVDDRPLSEEEKTAVISKVNSQGGKIFLMEKCPDRDGYEILIVVTDEETDDTVTYQIFYQFENCIAKWDRFAGPVNGNF